MQVRTARMETHQSGTRWFHPNFKRAEEEVKHLTIVKIEAFHLLLPWQRPIAEHSPLT